MKFSFLLKIYGAIIMYLGLIKPILYYNTQYESFGYGQTFITNNSIVLTILLLHNTIIIYPLIRCIFDIRFGKWVDLNIIFSLFMTFIFKYIKIV